MRRVEYQALYRKYRPQTFGEVVGQRHVTETLAHEVTEGKVAHAYLFAGPRGTGKTTTARILAKALNCPNRTAEGEPDNTCDSCVAVTDGTSLDVIELDAASHNKVEDIREIRVNVGTVASVGGAHRVYILDEAHMLSRAAGNALLKTLEEPPEHVIFVLATTEPYKLLDTIRSRAQRFDFHPIPGETLAAYLGELAGREGYELAPEAASVITHHARGSARDALSLMEQVAALGGGAVTARGVGRALGLADREAFERLVGAIDEGDAAGALALVAALAAEGADLRRFVADSLEFFRGLFLAHYAPNMEEIVDEGTDVIEQWRKQAARLSSAQVLRALDELGDALTQLREGREERLVLELALLRLVRPETASDTGALAARLDRVEDRLRRLASAAPAQAAEREAPPPAAAAAPVSPSAPFAAASDEPKAEEEEPAPEAPPEERPDLAPVEGLDLAAVETVWPALVTRVRDAVGPRRNALLREAKPASVEGATVVLSVAEHMKFHLEQLKADEELREVVEREAAELLGGGVTVQYREEEVAEQPSLLGEDEIPAAHELVDAGEGGIDPAELVVDMLGGQVVEDGAPGEG